MISTFLGKFFSGFAFWRGSVIGKILYIGILYFCFNFILIKFTQPTQKSEITNAEIVNIVEAKQSSAFFLGIKLWRVKLGATVE